MKLWNIITSFFALFVVFMMSVVAPWPDLLVNAKKHNYIQHVYLQWNPRQFGSSLVLFSEVVLWWEVHSNCYVLSVCTLILLQEAKELAVERYIPTHCYMFKSRPK